MAVPNERLIHDVAFATSQHILELFAGCIREEEQRDAFGEIYERIKSGIERFDIDNDILERRLNPGRN
jgi:hypothetical protein